MPVGRHNGGRPRSITIDSLTPTRSPSINDSLKRAMKPRSNSYNNLLSSPKTTVEFAGRYKVVAIGDNDCGKTCLLNAFSRRNYEVDTALTYDEGVSTIRYGSKQVEFVIWDLSGCTDLDGLRIELYKDADLFLVCYDIGNELSLESAVENWIPEILMEEPNASFLLVGCKNDLRNEIVLETTSEEQVITTDHKSFVTKSKAEQVARDWGAKDYIECCAKTGYNISEIFRSAAHVLLSTLDEKNNLYGFKGFSRFRRRKSPDTSEIFYSSYDSGTPMISDKFYPNYTRNYLRRASSGST